jgi:hypothetical protein
MLLQCCTTLARQKASRHSTAGSLHLQQSACNSMWLIVDACLSHQQVAAPALVRNWHPQHITVSHHLAGLFTAAVTGLCLLLCADLQSSVHIGILRLQGQVASTSAYDPHRHNPVSGLAAHACCPIRVPAASIHTKPRSSVQVPALKCSMWKHGLLPDLCSHVTGNSSKPPPTAAASPLHTPVNLKAPLPPDQSGRGRD